MSTKGEIDNSTIIVEDFNIQLISIGKLSRNKINTRLKIHIRSDKLNRYVRTFHPNAVEYSFF